VGATGREGELTRPWASSRTTESALLARRTDRKSLADPARLCRRAQ
jgi:hypothetical protein